MAHLRIAYLCEFPTLLGGERSLLEFLDHGAGPDAGAGIDPLVVAPHGGGLAAELLGRGIERLEWPPGGRASAADLSGELAGRGVQLVHGNALMVGDAALALGRALGVPALTHVRDIMALSRARAARLGELGAVVAVSNAVASRLVAAGVPDRRVLRIHNAVDPVRLRECARAGGLRRELGVDSRAPVLGSIGQLALRKGHDLFLEAASRLVPSFPEARFVIAGARYSEKDESRRHEEDLRRRAAAPPLAGRTRLLGYRADIPSILLDLDLLVVPSREEPFSRVILEALALGVPVLATDVGGSRELLGSGPDAAGILVPPEDPGALAAGAASVLRSSALDERLRVAGPPRAAAFSPGVQVRALTALYRRLLAGLEPA